MISSSPPQRQQRQDMTMMKKQVSFSSLEVHHPVSRHENPEDLWFTRLDELAFKQRDANMKTLLKHLSPIDLEYQLLNCNNEESCRGLEYAKSDTIRQIQLRKRSTKIAVLNTQSRCFAIGQDPTTSISRAYSMISKSAIQHAIQIAVNDEKYVDNHIRRSGCESSSMEEDSKKDFNSKQPSSSSSVVGGGRTTTITMMPQLRCPRLSPMTTTATFHQRTARTA